VAIRAKWKGGDDPTAADYEYHSGIEARDLTDEDWDALTTEQRATVRASNLYDYRTERESNAPRGARPRAEQTEQTETEGGDS
jgi:hypothetical protein